MKPLIWSLAILAIAPIAEAKKNNGNNQKAKEEEKQKQKEKAARDKKRNAVKAVLDKKDSNHDGSLTLDEYLTGETDAEAAKKRFDEYNKNGDRFLSKMEIEASLGL